jgi:threonine/homoserine/homoserine lactone efflux protein
VAVCAPLVLFAGHFAAYLKRSRRATRVVDWLLAGVLSAFAAKLILSHR